MKSGKFSLHLAAVACFLGSAGLIELTASTAHAQAPFVQDGEAGFVVSFIEYGLSKDAAETGACPNGMTLGGNRLREAVEAGEVPPPKEGSGEAFIVDLAGRFGQADNQQAQGDRPPDQQDRDAARESFRRLMQTKNPCSNPEEFEPDPYWRSVEISNTPVYGIDLDGQISHAEGKAAPGTCPHTDFPGFNGEQGIDNQLFRAVGCSPSFQPTGSSNVFNIEMLTGSWGILIRLRGVDDILNDDDVEVSVYANADPIQLSPSREPLEYATYAPWQDPRLRSVARGRIVNGVLTSDPVNFQFWKITNSIWLERPLRDMRLQMTLSPDGKMEGFMAGYTPVEALFDFQYAYRNGKTGPNGEPSPIGVLSALGGNVTVGHSCNGAWFALWDAADGHPDDSGRCTSISTQYHIEAIPAFIIDVETESSNAELGQPAPMSGY